MRPTRTRDTMMKKTTLFVCLASLLLAFSSCGKKEIEATHFPFKDSKNDNWGLVDGKGKVIVQDEFEHEPTPVINGMFFVRTKNWEYEMYSINDPKKPIGDTYYEIAPFTEDVTPSSKKGEGIKYIDKKGNVKFDIPKKYVAATPFKNGYSILYEEKGSSAVSTKGDIVSFSKYAILEILAKDKFLVVDKGDVEEQFYGSITKAYIVDHKGDVKATLKDFLIEDMDGRYLEEFFSPDLKYYIYCERNDYGLCSGVRSIDGETVIKAKEGTIHIFDDNGNVLCMNDDECGVKDIKGNVLIKNHYIDLKGIGNGLYIAMKKKKDSYRYGLINEKDEEIIPFDYEYMAKVTSNTVVVRKDFEKSRYILLDTKGRELGDYADFLSYHNVYGDIVRSGLKED